MSYVYVVNLPLMVARDSLGHARRDEDGEPLRQPSIDLSPALTYGEIRHVFQPGKIPVHPMAIVEMARDGLAEFTADDYLLLVGDPLAIGVATGVAMQHVDGSIRILRWFSRARQYEELMLHLALPSDDAGLCNVDLASGEALAP
jgi:hypothetical protein